MFYLLQNKRFNRVIALDLNRELILCYKIIKNDVQLLINELKILNEGYPAPEFQEKRENFYYEIRNKWNEELTEFSQIKRQNESKACSKNNFPQ